MGYTECFVHHPSTWEFIYCPSHSSSSRESLTNRLRVRTLMFGSTGFYEDGFFFIVLKLNFSGLTLQLFLNVWFKNWVDCHYRSASRLLHIIIQSFALLAEKPIFLWIYLKQLEGCGRSPESWNLHVGLVVW